MKDIIRDELGAGWLASPNGEYYRKRILATY